MLTQLRTITLATSLAALLGACGGGGGGGTASTPTTTTPSSTTSGATTSALEGTWSGTSSSGYTTTLVYLDDGRFYATFGVVTNGVLGVVGFDVGSGSVSGNSFTGTLNEYAYTGTRVTGRIAGTVSPSNTLGATVTYGNATTSTVSLSPISQSSYQYNRAASLNEVAGSWTGTMLDGSSATTVIAPSGTFTVANGGCISTGTAKPRASGKNILDVTVKFGPAPCLLPGQTGTGIGLSYALANGRQQLLVAVQDSSQAWGALFIATR